MTNTIHHTSSWREAAIARSEIITDAWEVTKTYAGRIAEWVLFGCMVMNIIEMLPGVSLWPLISNLVLGIQVVMLDVGGFSLASMGDYAREQGDSRAARKSSITGGFLIAIMILTLLLVSIGLLWPVAKTYTDLAEKGLILVRVIMTVIYGHVIHSLRRVTAQRQQATVNEQITELTERLTKSEQRLTQRMTELSERLSESEHGFTKYITELSEHVTESEQRMTEHVQRIANRFSVQFNERLEQTVSDHATRHEVASINETLGAHAHTLVELATLPALLEEILQEVETVKQQLATEHISEQANTIRPKLSLVEANTEHRTPNIIAKERIANSERDKGAFVRSCLAETPNMRNADIQRKASEYGMTISPAYISEVRKAFTREQSA